MIQVNRLKSLRSLSLSKQLRFHVESLPTAISRCVLIQKTNFKLFLLQTESYPWPRDQTRDLDIWDDRREYKEGQYMPPSNCMQELHIKNPRSGLIHRRDAVYSAISQVDEAVAQ